jgi:alginate O-acetyltransferase complex protein AlgI
MLFNSHIFIFVFLPIVLVGYYLLLKATRPALGKLWLVCGSLIFYGWWEPKYLFLILCSIGVNYLVGYLLQRSAQPSRAILTVGIAANLGALGFYKYSLFFVDTLNQLAGSDYHFEKIILPLAISFFTFQQITYLVDSYKKAVHHVSLLDYSLFVTFFPQLIAGPIVHHQEMLPQFSSNERRINYQSIAAGVALFFIGLFKKVVIADGMSQLVSGPFDGTLAGTVLSAPEAWASVIAYAFQIYFDFSGYSDMAIGLGALFGIRLPLNFFSPYKATSIIEFWHRWHITLSRLLKDYLYIPLGGNRRGGARRYLNLMITMLLGGLWHGAGWNFIIWGGLHGAYLMVNHFWNHVRPDLGSPSLVRTALSTALTFLAVCVAWTFFRAETLPSAILMLQSMSGVHGILPSLEFQKDQWDILTDLLAISCMCFFLPNAQQLLNRFQLSLSEDRFNVAARHGIFRLRLNAATALLASPLVVWTILELTTRSEFLYFNF